MVFDKVLNIISGTRENGHALANRKNVESLRVAKKEIEEQLLDAKRNVPNYVNAKEK